MIQKNYRYALWLIIFGVMFMSAYFTYPLCKKMLMVENIENRAKSEWPQFTWDEYSTYFQSLEKYINDALPYRDELIRMDSNIAYYGFKESASEQVVVGKHGWLFLRQELDDYKRMNLYSEDELKMICEKMEEIHQYLYNNRIEFVIFIAPNKSSVYPEFVPSYVKVGGEISRTEQLVDYLKRNTDIKVIFPRGRFEEHCQRHQEYPLYMHYDTHWNSLGGYYGAKILLQELDIKIPHIKKGQLKATNEPVFLWNGFDLANAMGMTGALTEDINYNIIGYSDSMIKWEGNPVESRNDFETVCSTTSNAIDSRKIIFIRDSFGTSMLPIIAGEFQEVYSPHVSYLNTEKIKLSEQHPNIVIYEVVERSGLQLDLIDKFED